MSLEIGLVNSSNFTAICSATINKGKVLGCGTPIKRKLILCLDDEKIILDSLKMQLKSALPDEYVYEFSQDGEDGLEIIDEYCEDGVDVVVIVSDWLMPGMRGDEFLIKVHKKYPKVVKVMLTGQADDAAIERAYEQANLYKLLRKPWDKDDLINTIQEGLKSINYS